MSNSRLEKFIYAICSMEVSDLPAPLSRIEILWNCLITGETPDFEPQSRNEQYLMAMLGLYELDQLPTPMSRGEKLLYKIAMGETDLSDIPAYLSRYEELLGYLAENGGVGDFEYILQTLNQRLSTLYSTKERPMKQAVIKGDTFVNELPRPSLKNKMVNVASQKLNQGYDNGKTLVNIYDIKTSTAATQGVNINGVICTLTANAGWVAVNNKLPMLQPSKTYTVIVNIITNTLQYSSNNHNWGLQLEKVDNNTGFSSGYEIPRGSTGIFKVALTTKSDFTNISNLSDVRISPSAISGNIKFTYMVIEGDYTNEDIPYFEGTKTFSATPNVVDGEFKQAVVKGNTILWDNVNNEEVLNSDLPLDVWVEGYATIDENTGEVITSTVDTITHFLKIPSNLARITGTASWKKIFYYNAEKIYIGYQRTDSTTRDLVVTIPDNTVYIRLLYYKPSNDLTFNLIDNDGNTIELARDISMQSVRLSEVTTTGKNLFYKENVVNGIFMSGSLSIQPTNANLTIGKDNAIKVEPNTSYTFSFVTGWQVGALGLNATKTAITLDTKWQTNSNGYTFTTDANTNYVTFNIAKTDSSIIQPSDIDNAKIILEKGSVATPYEPYQSNTLTTNEEIIIRSLPNGVCDTFNALTGVYTQRIGDDIFVGADNEAWWIASIYNEGDAISFRIKRQTKPAAGTVIPSDIICDKFKIVTPRNAWGNDNYDGEGVSHGTTLGDGIDVRILKSKLSAANIQGFKEWLSKNPIRVQYELQKPITKTINTTITDQDGATQTKLHSFNDGHLSVSSQGLLPSAVNYEVPTNNSYYLPDMLTLGAQYTSRGSADCHATIDGKLLALGKNGTFTTPSTLTNRLMVLDAPVDDLMFIKGDQTAKDFGYFEGMKSVGLSNKMPVLTTTGKNLIDERIWDTETVEEGYDCLLFDGFVNIDIDGKVGNPFIIPVNIEKGKTYALKCKNKATTYFNIFYLINDGSLSTKQALVRNDRLGSFVDTFLTFTANMDYKYLYIDTGNNGAYGYIVKDTLQIEEGSTATEYEPFKSNILTTSEDVVLRGIGEVHDELDCLTGEVTERIGEVVYTGDENWYSITMELIPDNMVFYLPLSNYLNNTDNSEMRKLIKDNLGFTNNCFSGTVNDPNLNGKKGFSIHDNGHVYFTISKSECADISAWKNKLKEQPLVLQYAIKPTVKTVDLTTVDQDGQPTKLKTFNDISYVEMNADPIVPSVDVEVATKINETLSTMGLQHHDISNTQNKLSQTIDEQAENTDATMMATTEIYEQTL